MDFKVTWASATNLWNSSFSVSVVRKELPVVTDQVDELGGKRWVGGENPRSRLFGGTYFDALSESITVKPVASGCIRT